jgi:uncharacterized repeat protein (TIGR01451 family)
MKRMMFFAVLLLCVAAGAQAQSDASVTMSTASSTYAQGDTVTYNVIVRNNSYRFPVITLTDVLPAGLTFVSATGQNAQCQNNSGTVTCVFISPMPYTNIPATIKATVNTASTTITNTVTVQTQSDPNLSNNSASVMITIW